MRHPLGKDRAEGPLLAKRDHQCDPPLATNRSSYAATSMAGSPDSLATQPPSS